MFACLRSESLIFAHMYVKAIEEAEEKIEEEEKEEEVISLRYLYASHQT
jgi:hypothetical protein